MNNIWLTSDTHYNHSNLCLGVSTWNDKEKSCRNFQTLEEMNELIVKNINDNVKENDVLYHLGDFSFGGIKNIWEFRKRINCKNIHLIFGNHDHHISSNKVLPKCHSKYNYDLDEYIIYDNDPYPLSFVEDECRAKDLFLSTQHYLDLEVNKQHLILSHFPIEEWDGIGKNYIHLHGHCHGSKNNSLMNTEYKRIDVGMDWSEFRPYHIDEIFKLMKDRKNFIRHE